MSNDLWNKRREKLEMDVAAATSALLNHVGVLNFRLHLSDDLMICVGTREGIAHLLDATLGEEKIVIGAESQEEDGSPIQPSKKAQLRLVLPEPKS
ncbi:hypothetical protein DLP3_091 [Stenotrophomonas phage vB_SmaS_DLP_3]|nr:hypothetical protein DLP3_091 [Stenotrophomonas phage vB_SmaS_DLP_3]